MRHFCREATGIAGRPLNAIRFRSASPAAAYDIVVASDRVSGHFCRKASGARLDRSFGEDRRPVEHFSPIAPRHRARAFVALLLLIR
jgi:hypothetical protein